MCFFQSSNHLLEACIKNLIKLREVILRSIAASAILNMILNLTISRNRQAY